MNTTPIKGKLPKLLTMSAAGLLLAAQAAVAENANPTAGPQSQTQPQTQSTDQFGSEQPNQQMEFSEVDTNGDNQIDWQELDRAYDNQLSEAGLTEEQLLQEYDQNQDRALDEAEYHAFTTGFMERQEYSATEIEGAAGQQADDELAAGDAQQTQPAQQDQTAVGESDEEFAGTEDSEATDAELAATESTLETEQQDQDMAATESTMETERQDQDMAAAGAETEGTQQDDEMAATGGQAPAQEPIGGESQAQDQQQGQDGSVEAIVGVTQIQQIPIEEIADREVVNLEGDKVGKVEDVVRSQDGTTTGLVVKAGGFLGLGAKEVVIDVNQVHLTEDQVVWEQTEKNAVDDLPEYNEDDYVSVR